jgi:hypothetical protein
MKLSRPRFTQFLEVGRFSIGKMSIWPSRFPGDLFDPIIYNQKSENSCKKTATLTILIVGRREKT